MKVLLYAVRWLSGTRDFKTLSGIPYVEEPDSSNGPLFNALQIVLCCGTIAAYYVQLRAIYRTGKSIGISLALVTAYALFAMVIGCVYLSIFHRPRWSRSDRGGAFLPMNADEVLNGVQVAGQVFGAVAMALYAAYKVNGGAHVAMSFVGGTLLALPLVGVIQGLICAVAATAEPTSGWSTQCDRMPQIVGYFVQGLAVFSFLLLTFGFWRQIWLIVTTDQAATSLHAGGLGLQGLCFLNAGTLIWASMPSSISEPRLAQVFIVPLNWLVGGSCVVIAIVRLGMSERLRYTWIEQDEARGERQPLLSGQHSN